MIGDYWEKAELPWPLMRRMGELGLIGDGIEGYGCPKMSPVAVGLVSMELNRGDGSLGTFARRAGRAGHAVHRHARLRGAEAALAATDGPAGQARRVRAHRTQRTAPTRSAWRPPPRRDGDTWVINGEKKWIGNGTIADVVVLWARDTADGQVKGFLVEKGMPGYDARRIDGKVSLRSVWQAQITLTDLRVPEANRLPGARTFKDTGRVLAGTRNAVAWAALGHATAAYEIAAGLLPAAAAVRQAAGRASRSCSSGWSRCSPRCAPCSCTAASSAGCRTRAR